MYLLDPDVVFELRRPAPHPSLVRWITEAPSDQMFLSAGTLGDIQARDRERARLGSRQPPPGWRSGWRP